MRQKMMFVILIFTIIIFMVACGDNNNNGDLNNLDEELKSLDVQFDVPEQLDVGETLELAAVVTYGDENVTDANEVYFEVWEKGDKDNSDDYDSENNGDGTYTAEVTFEDDGIYEMYAHTTAHGQHTMPLREVTVGEGGNYDDTGNEQAFETDGFDMQFMEVDDVEAGEEIELVTHVTMDEEHLADLNVRYEIWTDDDEDNRDWIDASEVDEKYIANHTFSDVGMYNIQIHVEDDEDLHEHVQETVTIEE